MTSQPPADNLDVVLRDGSTVLVRPADERDIGAVLTFLAALAPGTLYALFPGVPAITETRIRQLLSASDGHTTAIVAESGGSVVAFAGFSRDAAASTRAEAAFVVSEAVQGHGIGTRLLERLVRVGRAQGITAFDAHVPGEHGRLLDVFRNSGLPLSTRLDAGGCRLTLTLTDSDRFEELATARSQIAAVASMTTFFEPHTVAVVGANRERGKIGSELLHNLVAAGFTGRIVPVHPAASTIAGLAAYPHVSDVPGEVDLAVVVVPAAEVLSAVDDCIRKHVPAICVISAGFSESGADGRAREALLIDRIRRAGCRLIGPNCMGLVNTDPRIRLNATFSPVYPPIGGVAMSTQSGALGLAILDYAQRLGIGISSFVSVGNKADVSSNDLIQYWADDPRTSVILLYLESFGNPANFSKIARRVARTKPIVAVKAGRSAAGSRAAASHTGALASSDAVVDALFRQAGVIRTDRLEELFDVATMLSHQPLPGGNRVAIVTNAGGPAILAADACEANGLTLPALPETTRAQLRTLLPAAASVGNPVDMLAAATPDQYRQVTELVLREPVVDSVIVIFIPPVVTDPAAAAAAVADATRAVPGKPVLGVFMRGAGAPGVLAPIPAYAFPESAALALARVTRYAEWRARPAEAPAVMDGIDHAAIRAIVTAILARGGGWATPDECGTLLSASGIPVAASRVATTIESALQAADAVGFPVALKALGPTLLHKTELRAVALNLSDAAELRRAYEDYAQRFGHAMTSVLVQRMVPAGVEMIVGVVQDPQFGPVIACGFGGVLVDLLNDVAVRLHPLAPSDAREMVEGLRGARLLRGYRGAPPADEAALREIVLRVSQVMSVAPEIQELDLNPLIVQTTGACVADVRVRIDAGAPAQRGRRVEY